MEGTRILKNKFRLMNARLETNRHPRRAFIFLATNGLSIGSLSNKQNAPGRNYFTPMEGGLQWKSQARLSSYQWT